MKVCVLSSFGDLSLKDTGQSVRLYYLAKTLRDLGHRVEVVIPGKKAEAIWIDGILVHKVNGLCPEGILRLLSNLLGVLRYTSLYFYDFLFVKRALRVIRKCDLVQIEQPWAGGFLIPLLMKLLAQSFIVDSHDVFQSLRIKHTGLTRKILEVCFEKMAYYCADLILTVSKREKKLLIDYGFPPEKIAVIPNGVDTITFRPECNKDYNEKLPLTDPHVIFVGNMEYLPNREAVKAIASHVAPEVRKELGKVEFLIVGRAPQDLRDKYSFSLTFSGSVDDVVRFLVDSDVAIAPLFQGSGTRLKILEYFSCGLPVVSTTIGVEGLEVENGVNVFVEDDMEKFASRIVELLSNRRLSDGLGRAARELVVSKYDWQAIGKQLENVYHNIL